MYVLQVSTAPFKKYMIITPNKKIIHFGDNRYKDFTLTNDTNRKTRYLMRHKAREDWTKSGMDTSGFWSRWLLWNKPSLVSSIKDVEKRFKIKIHFKK